jgi:hypothetical protein
MGSPFNVCALATEGAAELPLPDRPWQDRHAQSEEHELHALVYWDVRSNEPGFRVVICNPTAGSVHESQRFPGCCEALAWHGRRLRVSVPDGVGFYLDERAT